MNSPPVDITVIRFNEIVTDENPLFSVNGYRQRANELTVSFPMFTNRSKVFLVEVHHRDTNASNRIQPTAEHIQATVVSSHTFRGVVKAAAKHRRDANRAVICEPPGLNFRICQCHMPVTRFLCSSTPFSDPSNTTGIDSRPLELRSRISSCPCD